MSLSNVIFIDSRVSGYQEFIYGIAASTEVVLLNTESDGIDQIASYLRGRTGSDVIHVISHSSESSIYHGSAVLSSNNLVAYEFKLSSSGSAQIQTGDVLLGGCNGEQGYLGMQFIRLLGNNTVAYVSASSNATGVSLLGCDRVLEEFGNHEETASTALKGLIRLLSINANFGFKEVPATIGNISSTAVMVLIQANGKILLARLSANSSSAFAMMCSKSYATMDTTFGIDSEIYNTLNGAAMISASAVQDKTLSDASTFARANGLITLGYQWRAENVINNNSDLFEYKSCNSASRNINFVSPKLTSSYLL